MATKLAVAACIVLASLQVGVHAHHDALETSSLARRTHEAQRSLDSLPSHCSTGTTELILAEESRVTSLIQTCEKSSIFIHLSELFTDTDYFGINLYNNGKILYSDWKECSGKKFMFEKLICAFEKSSGASEAALKLAFGAFSYLLEVAKLVPTILKEIIACRRRSETEYQQFLDVVVRKATMC